MTDWLTLGIAIWGAILSTVLVIYRIFENRRDLKIRLVISDTEVPPHNNHNNLVPVLYLCCVNKGKRPIQLHTYGFKLPNKKLMSEIPQLFPLQTSLPKTLNDGEFTSLLFDTKTIAKKLSEQGYNDSIEIIGYIGDSHGKRYFSKKMKFDIG